MSINKPTVLCISAIDSLGLSGLHADLRALNSMGVHGASCITATTAQTQNEFYSLNAVSDVAFISQLDALAQQDMFNVIKIGMLANRSQVDILLSHRIIKNKKIVLDPVLSASSGSIELAEERLSAIKELLSLTSLVTPNLDEAQLLLGIQDDNLQILADSILNLGAGAVLVKGGHSDNASTDLFKQPDIQFYLEHEVYPHQYSRGTGCMMASLIAGGLALNASIADAVTMAKMQMQVGWKKPFNIDKESGSLTLSEWINPLKFNVVSEPKNLDQLETKEQITLPTLYRSKKDCSLSFKPCILPLGLYPIFESAHWLERILPLGIRIAQLRIKDLEGEALKSEIKRAIEIAKRHDCQLFINDYWQLAIECGAHGVHLGQGDIDDADLEAISEADLSLGVSSHCFYEVARAKTINPSYIAFGPVYETKTKDMPWIPQGPAGLKYWRAQLPSIPIVAIGGIHDERFRAVRDTGVDAIAMITAITLADDPRKVTANYISQFSDTNDLTC